MAGRYPWELSHVLTYQTPSECAKRGKEIFPSQTMTRQNEIIVSLPGNFSKSTTLSQIPPHKFPEFLPWFAVAMSVAHVLGFREALRITVAVRGSTAHGQQHITAVDLTTENWPRPEQ